MSTLLDSELLTRVLRAALEGGGDFAEVFVEDKHTENLDLEDGKIERVQSGRDRGAGVRVIVGESEAYAFTDDLSPEALLAAARAAGGAARRSAPGAGGPGGGGWPGGRGTGDGPIVLDLRPLRPIPVPSYSPIRVPPLDYPKSDKVELLLRADRAARRIDPHIRQVSAFFLNIDQRVQIANSVGLLVEDHRVRTQLAVSAVAARDGEIQTGSHNIGKEQGMELFETYTPEIIAERAARQAMTNLYAGPAPSGPMPVVMTNGWGGVLFHEACGHGLEADAIHKHASVFAGRIGEQLAHPAVTAIDDATIPGEWGTFGVDDEGQPAQRTVLIENGVLRDYMYDLKTSRQAGRASTGNGRRQSYQHLPIPRMTNTFIAPGEASDEDLVAETRHGFYAAALRGGQVNPATGDFVFTVSEGYLIENGKIGDAVRGATLIGNGPAILKRIDMVGRVLDFGPGTCGKAGQGAYAACGQPSLRITELTVGGTSTARAAVAAAAAAASPAATAKKEGR